MKNYINWKVFFILLILSLISVICVFPYVLTIQWELIKKIGQPALIIFIAQFIQSIILFSVVIFFGLFFTKIIGLGLPIIEAILNKKDYKIILKNILGMSVLIWIGTALIIYILDIFFTFLGATITTHQNFAPIWQKLLAAFYGGIAEEIIMRLFLMTFFIWIGTKIFKQNQRTKIIIIVSIFITAIIFGLWHLPITESLTKLDSLIITRAIVLNGIGWIIFGYLFWKKWLESAIITHFTTDIFLLTVLPLVFW